MVYLFKDEKEEMKVKGGLLMAKSKAETWLTDGGLAMLKGWARDGLTDEQIAKNMKIGTSTLYVYKNKYIEIAEALKEGKEYADYEIENSLYNRAKGYTLTLKKPIKVKTVFCDDCGKKIKEVEEVIDATYEMHVPANITAQIYWLNNRCPDRWRRNWNREQLGIDEFKYKKEKDDAGF